MKFVSRLLMVLLVLAVVLIIAVVGVILTFDPNDYRQRIEETVETQTGRDLTIGGDIGFSFFPHLGLQLEDVSLGNAEGFSGRPFAAVDAVSVSVQLLPLLRRELLVDTVYVDGARISLERQADGRSNWEDLAQGQPAPEGQAEAGSGKGLAALQIGGVEITAARLDWHDAQSGQDFTLQPLNLSLGAVEFGKPVPLKLEAGFQGQAPQLDATLTLKAELTVAEGAQQFSATGLELEIGASGADLPMERLRAVLESPRLKADLANQVFVLEQLQAELEPQGGDLPVADQEIHLQAALEADLKQQTARMEELEVRLLDARLHGQAKAENLLGELKVIGQLTLDELNARELLQALKLDMPPMADDGALQRLSMSTELTAGKDRLALKPLSVTLDDSKLTGDVAVSQFAKPAVRFQLALDQLDADRYLPPPTEEEKPSPEQPAATGDEAIELPVEMLRDLDVAGRLSIGRLKLMNLKAQDLNVEILAKDGQLQAKPLSMKLYEGQLQGQAQLDVRAQAPRYAAVTRLEGVQVGPLLKDFTGDDKLSGTTRLEADLKTQGASVNALKQGLNGSASFAFTDGAVKGFNIAAAIRRAQGALTGKPVAEEGTEKKTDFSALTGSARISNGVVNNPDLEAKSPLLRVNGKGDIDLPQERLDYQVKTTVVGTLKGQGGKELEELKGVPIPVRIKGSFEDPDISVDLASAITAKQKAKVEEKVEEKREELKEDLKEKLQDRLKGLPF